MPLGPARICAVSNEKGVIKSWKCNFIICFNNKVKLISIYPKFIYIFVHFPFLEIHIFEVTRNEKHLKEKKSGYKALIFTLSFWSSNLLLHIQLINWCLGELHWYFILIAHLGEYIWIVYHWHLNFDPYRNEFSKICQKPRYYKSFFICRIIKLLPLVT